MNTNEINIRDPFVMLHGDTYYLYGTNSQTCWSEADCFDCYTSKDMEDWDGPFVIFHRPQGFFADRCYWAPECCYHNEKFYLLTTFASESRKKGIYTLVSDAPLGPFQPLNDQPLTPLEWTCIDGSLFWDANNAPYLLFSRTFEDDPKGAMCVVELSKDLSKAINEPRTLFWASDAPWAVPLPFAKEEFHLEGDVFLSDGPCVHRMDNGALVMLWSSWSQDGYAVGTAISRTGDILGPWEHLTEKLFPKDGGHGMLFTSKTGCLMYALHYPNAWGQEHPLFAPVCEHGGALKLSDCK